MTAINDITGDVLHSKAANEKYRNNYDTIFGQKEKPTASRVPDVNPITNSDVPNTAQPAS